MKVHVWDEKYTTGEKEIDDQHRQLFLYLRELQLGLYGEITLDSLLGKIREFQNYGLTHFASEKKVMDQYAPLLPMYEDHIKEHDSFVKKTVEFAERIDTEGTPVAHELCEYIAKWLVNHIISMDLETFIAVQKIRSEA